MALKGFSQFLLEETFLKLKTVMIAEVADWFQAQIARSGEDA